MNRNLSSVTGNEVARPRILVIRRDNIGDLVCTTPLIFALRERFPFAHIAALVNTYNEPVLSGNAAIDAVYTCEKRKAPRGEALHCFCLRRSPQARDAPSQGGIRLRDPGDPGIRAALAALR